MFGRQRFTQLEAKDILYNPFAHERPWYDRVCCPFVYVGIITKTCLYNFNHLKPNFYIVKLGFTGVYIIFLISALNHRFWGLVRTASVPTIYVLDRNMKHIRAFYLNIFSFWM